MLSAAPAVTGDADEVEDECPVIGTREMKRPTAATTSAPRDPEAAQSRRKKQQEEEEEEERSRQSRLKQRAKSAAKRTGKALGSSLACGACVATSGLVTLCCGIVMMAVGSSDREADISEFTLIGGVVFFLFGLAMVSVAVIYTVIHYYRKRKREQADPFKLKAAERERQEREARAAAARKKAEVSSSGGRERAVSPRMVPLACAPEHEHEVVTQHRVAEARRASLFSTSQSTSQLFPEEPRGSPITKSTSAFALEPLSNEEGGKVRAFLIGGPLPPIQGSKSSNCLPELGEGGAGGRGGKRGMSKSKSAAQVGSHVDSVEAFSMGHVGGGGPLPPIKRGGMQTIQDIDADDF